MPDGERVLFIHAHPDDETISTGGTLATLVDRGAAVTVVTCTRGERGEVVAEDLRGALVSSEAMASLRSTELTAALGILGVSDHRFLGDANARWSTNRPRRYVDSGMSWGPDGAGPGADNDPDSLTAAEFGEVAADIAAVVLDVQPHAIVSYDARGGYGHPDHIRAHEAALRAARVYDIPFFAIDPDGAVAATGHETLARITVDVTPVLVRKTAALAAHRSQAVVGGGNYALADGREHPIESMERFTWVPDPSNRETTFRQLPGGVKVAATILAVLVGAAFGSALTVYHQSTIALGATAFPIGLVAGIAALAALFAGLRLVSGSRVVAAAAAIGAIALVFLLSLESAGGSVLVQNTPTGLLWSLAPVVVMIIVVVWPDRRRASSG